MEALDEFLRRQNMNLDDLIERQDVLLDTATTTTAFTNSTDTSYDDDEAEGRGAAAERNRRLSESLLRHDVVAPKVIRLSMTHASSRRKKSIVRAAALLGIVLALSLYGFSYFSRTVWSLSHEAVLDIESKNITTMTTSHVATAVSSSSSSHSSSSHDD